MLTEKERAIACALNNGFDSLCDRATVVADEHIGEVFTVMVDEITDILAQGNPIFCKSQFRQLVWECHAKKSAPVLPYVESVFLTPQAD